MGSAEKLKKAAAIYTIDHALYPVRRLIVKENCLNMAMLGVLGAVGGLVLPEPLDFVSLVAGGYLSSGLVDCVIRALTRVKYVLTVATTTGGTTDPPPGDYTYVEGTSAEVTAIPDSGYSFDNWILDGATYTINPITVSMDGPHSLTAYFSAIPPPYDEWFFGFEDGTTQGWSVGVPGAGYWRISSVRSHDGGSRSVHGGYAGYGSLSLNKRWYFSEYKTVYIKFWGYHTLTWGSQYLRIEINYVSKAFKYFTGPNRWMSLECTIPAFSGMVSLFNRSTSALNAWIDAITIRAYR